MVDTGFSIMYGASDHSAIFTQASTTWRASTRPVRPLSWKYRAPETATFVQGGNPNTISYSVLGGSHLVMSAPIVVRFPVFLVPLGCCVSTIMHS